MKLKKPGGRPWSTLHPATQLKSSVSAEVLYISSQTPESNREEEHGVRKPLHLQASPHPYLLGKASHP